MNHFYLFLFFNRNFSASAGNSNHDQADVHQHQPFPLHCVPFVSLFYRELIVVFVVSNRFTSVEFDRIMFLTLKLPLFAIGAASVTTTSPHCFHHTALTFLIPHSVSASPLCPKCGVDECELIVVSFLLSIIITILMLLPLFIYHSHRISQSWPCAALSSTQH